MQEVFEYAASAVRTSQRPVFLEIGAAHGEDTKRLIETIRQNSTVLTGQPTAYEYYAFEPDPRNIIDIKQSPTIQAVHLIQAAVGAECGRKLFNQSGGRNPDHGRDHTISGSLKKPVEHLAAHPWCKFDSQVEVRVVSLDEFFDFYSLPHIDFIWCDVQGAEDLVIKGGTFALKHTRFFYTEYYNNQMYEGQISAREIFDRLPGDWRIVKQWSNDILFENLCPLQRSVLS